MYHLKPQRTLQPFTSGCTWVELYYTLKLLKVADPAGLPSRSNLLSYVKDGKAKAYMYLLPFITGILLACYGSDTCFLHVLVIFLLFYILHNC